MTGPSDSLEAVRDRFKVSYPFPIAMGAGHRTLMW